MDIVKAIIWSKNRVTIQFPFAGMLDQPSCFGESEIGDALSFGFSYVEHEDHTVRYILAGPKLMKEILRDVTASVFTCGTDYIGELWTAKFYLTDRVPHDHVMFANSDISVVLDLNLNHMEETENADLRVQV